ncbi:SAF domain-containing protein [Geodermatophilus obscurus]|uniref:SAF domain protein n=1 Tax=Geodermatophilus obscurus (strain ATCC 25078 / DSM 43160 / JCM 3152 / CCUG 61914 / KCC A-0152 / KCTC 9177 / NBRC 13315 / NRRL B-3577 / G-20) TaxID=526225 RepID=D2S7E6_GEOOG|nr:SAF domain-containing protein [Geodermatophilus obscurus]ADB73446.1 SAF domain protein [Geodermatophilus obscurus DSM 43160]
MTRTQPPRTSPPDRAAAVNGSSRAPALPPPRRRRRPALLALALTMVVLGALGAAYLATSLGATSSIIAVAREVPWGQQLTAADLVEARVSADPVLTPIPYAQRDQVIGMVAATTLTPGSLLTREALIEQPLPPAGQQLVGVGVSAVQLPTTPLRPGDDVLLVPVAGSGGAQSPTAPVAPRTVPATVVRSGSPGTDGLRVVDVLVDAADGPDVAARAAAGLVAIVVVAGE